MLLNSARPRMLASQELGHDDLKNHRNAVLSKLRNCQKKYIVLFSSSRNYYILYFIYTVLYISTMCILITEIQIVNSQILNCFRILYKMLKRKRVLVRGWSIDIQNIVVERYGPRGSCCYSLVRSRYQVQDSTTNTVGTV